MQQWLILFVCFERNLLLFFSFKFNLLLAITFILNFCDLPSEIAPEEVDGQSSSSKGVDDTCLNVTSHTKIDWSPVMDQFFLELMLDQVRKGNKIGRTFKKKSWADMIEAFNDRFGCHYGKVVLKNRYNVLRRHYCSIKILLGKEGFSWDKTQQKVVADDQAWQKCIRVSMFPLVIVFFTFTFLCFW